MIHNKYDYAESASDDESDDEKYSSEEDEEIQCKNIDPGLAKLMGIIIEEQRETDWKPPSKSGLENSDKIISSVYFTNKNFIENDIDYFTVIKDNIINYKPLNEKQLEYIKNVNDEEKFELIQIYNTIMNKSYK